MLRLPRQRPAALTGPARVSNGRRRARQRGDRLQALENRNSQASGLYRALTLSPVSSGELGKMRSPRMHAAGNSEVVVKRVLIGPSAWVEDQVRVNPTDPQTDFTAR